MKDGLLPHETAHLLRSSVEVFLYVPPLKEVHIAAAHERVFSVVTPRLWNLSQHHCKFCSSIKLGLRCLSIKLLATYVPPEWEGESMGYKCGKETMNILMLSISTTSSRTDLIHTQEQAFSFLDGWTSQAIGTFTTGCAHSSMIEEEQKTEPQ